MVNTILKEANLFCPNSVRINFTIYHLTTYLANKLRCKFAELLTSTS
ncbi:ABC transporter ATP-binding protein [Limosilactobacillus pontis]|nr:ABC transporter ATP-binding protein [Limosilactobacillus pontis]